MPEGGLGEFAYCTRTRRSHSLLTKGLRYLVYDFPLLAGFAWATVGGMGGGLG